MGAGRSGHGDLIILAVQRRGEDQGPDETVLTVGDTLLLQGTWKALDEHLADPDVLAAATEMGISPRGVLMSVNVAAAAALLTPVATPTNLMVMGPGGYRFGDYAKLGLPLMVWFFVVATFIVPIFWRF